MATKKPKPAAKESTKKARANSEPRFPYTTKPSSLRRLLQEIPKKPRPPKFDKDLLRSWGFTDANDYSMLRVLKAIGLLNEKNEPTEIYSRYMHLEGGAAALAEPIKRIYQSLFTASHKPYTEPNERLQNLFNIHSGGTDRALEQQIQTFKALCENTIFDGAPPPAAAIAATPISVAPATPAPAGAPAASININLHILPENKSRRDYEAIIEDIGRYIFGRTDSQHRDE